MIDKLTVIVPVFNREDYIETTLMSVINQNPDLNILVIDNHSDDNTYDIVLNLCKKFKNIQLIKNSSNYGRIQNFNEGLHYTKTEWASFLIAGDEYLPNWFRTINNSIKSIHKDNLEKINLINAYADNFKVYPENNLIVSGNEFVDKVLSGKCTFLGPNNNIIRVSEAKRCGGFPVGFQYCFDWSLFSFISRNSNILLINKNLMKQNLKINRVHNTGISSRACEPDNLKPILANYFQKPIIAKIKYSLISTIRFYGVLLNNFGTLFKNLSDSKILLIHLFKYHILSLPPALILFLIQNLKKR